MAIPPTEIYVRSQHLENETQERALVQKEPKRRQGRETSAALQIRTIEYYYSNMLDDRICFVCDAT